MSLILFYLTIDGVIAGDASGRLLAYDYTKGAVTKNWDGHSKSISKVKLSSLYYGNDEFALSLL